MLRANIRLPRDTARKLLATEKMSNKRAIIFLFPDVEETEFVITANVLRRAGIDVTVVGLGPNVQPIKGCQNILITPDKGTKSF